jgi:hypothetical protein
MSTTQLAGPTQVNSDGVPRLCLRLVHGDSVVLELWGELGADTGHLLTELVEYVVSGEPTNVVLDLEHMRPLATAGMRALRLAQTMLVAAGFEVTLRGAASHPLLGGLVSPTAS